VVSVVSSIADADYRSAWASLQQQQASAAGADATNARPPIEVFLEAVAVLRKNQFMPPSSAEARSPEYVASLKALGDTCDAKAASRSAAAPTPAPKALSAGGAALLKTLMSAKEEAFSDEEDEPMAAQAAAAGQKRKADEISVTGPTDEEDEDMRIKAMAVAALDALNVAQAAQGSAAAVEEEPSFIAMTSTDTLLNEEISSLSAGAAPSSSSLTVVSAAFDAGAEELSFRPSAPSGGAPSSVDLDREVMHHLQSVLTNSAFFDIASPEVCEPFITVFKIITVMS
jgi:hypothetical protein